MLKIFSTAGLRIVVTLFPLLLILLLIEKLPTSLASDISYSFAISQLLALICRAGLDVYINQNHCFSMSRREKLHILGLLLSKVILACIALCSLLWIFVDTRISSIGFVSFCLNVSLLASLWLTLSFIQAQGYSRLALLVTIFPSNLLILAAVLYGFSQSLSDFYQSFNAILALCLMLGISCYLLLPKLALHKPNNLGYRFSALLWLNAVAGTGTYWFIQVYLGATLNAESYVLFLALLRFGQIPMAAIVGSGFLVQSRFSHNEKFGYTEKKRYLQLCLLSLSLAACSAAAIPIILQFSQQTGALLSPTIIWLIWLAGLTSSIFGPIAILMAIYHMVKPAIYIRLLNTALFLACSHFFYSQATPQLWATGLALSFFVLQFGERLLLFVLTFYKLPSQRK